MLQNILENIKKYQSVIAWILEDSILRFKKKVFLIVISGFLGVALQLQTIALVFYYAKSLETGKIISVLDYSINIRSSQLILIILGIIILISLILAAWLNYYSRNRLLKLWRIYEEFCAKRVFHILAEKRLRLSFFYQEIIDDDTRLLKILRTDSRYCGRVLEIVLSIFTPTVTAIISIGALIYINPLLTVLLILPLTTTIFFWYRASREASNNASLLEQYSSNASTEYRSLIRWFKQDVYSLPTNYIENLYNYLENSRQFLDAFEGRLNSLAKSDLASNIFLAITIFMILMVLGWNIISQQAGWGELIIYIFALRYSLFNIRQVTQKITAINLFYPHIKRYFHFLSIADQVKDIEEKLALIPFKYQLKNPFLLVEDSYSEKKEIEPSSTIALITSAKLNQYYLFEVLKNILDHSHSYVQSLALSSLFISSSKEYLPGVPLNLLLSIPHISARSRLLKELEGSGIETQIEKELPKQLNYPITEYTWNNISSEIKIAIGLATMNFYRWFFIEEVTFKKLPKATQNFFLQKQASTVLCIIFNEKRINQLGNFGEKLVIGVNDKKVTFMNTIDNFLLYNDEVKKKLLESIITPQTNKKQKNNLSNQMEDDDETLINL